MKLPFFKKSKDVDDIDFQSFLIAVVLSDWCPACLEYKVVLNKILSNTPIKIEFLSEAKLRERDLSIRAIPTTLFIGDKHTETKQISGFLTYNEFLLYFFEFYNKRLDNKELINK